MVRGILDGLHHRGVAVAGAANRDARREIQEAVAVDVPDLRALAVRHHERIVARIGRRDHQRIARQQLARFGSRQIGLDVRFFMIRLPLDGWFHAPTGWHYIPCGG